ncbi:MAG: preprotein translocase subunit YajC [Deferribacterales bacterium]|nr:preprotein translocase subunit YajC [Deferribacterales bacterium]
MFFDSVAYAQAAGGAAASPMGALGSFLPLILIFVVFYFLLIRPQQKRQKQHMAMIDALKAGDQILTNGGIYGTITSVIDTQTFLVEIANGVKVKVAKGGIAAKIDPTQPTVDGEKK